MYEKICKRFIDAESLAIKANDMKESNELKARTWIAEKSIQSELGKTLINFISTEHINEFRKINLYIIRDQLKTAGAKNVQIIFGGMYDIFNTRIIVDDNEIYDDLNDEDREEQNNIDLYEHDHWMRTFIHYQFQE